MEGVTKQMNHCNSCLHVGKDVAGPGVTGAGWVGIFGDDIWVWKGMGIEGSLFEGDRGTH